MFSKRISKLLLIFFMCCNAISCSENVTGKGTTLGLDCDFIDIFDPILEPGFIQNIPAALTKSPEYTWSAGVDLCGIDHYEVAIGTTPLGNETLDWNPIGDTTTYRAENLILNDGVTYYYSIRALDAGGNISNAITGPGFIKIDPVADLPNMILRLNGDSLSSLIDGGGLDANNGSFSSSVQQWRDTSGSTNVHNWFSVGAANRPTFLPADNGLQFNGTNQYMTVNNHNDLNLGTVNERNFTVAFESSANITSRQIVYEEGAGVRGMNIYIEGGNVYCGFWNTNNDGDGVQAFVSVNTPISTNTRYNITWVFNYLNYTGPAGPDGSLTCYLNGTQIGVTQNSTSLLYAHSGALGLGAQVSGSYFHDGVDNNSLINYFTGKIFEVMIVESVPTPAELVIINEYLVDKWNM